MWVVIIIIYKSRVNSEALQRPRANITPEERLFQKRIQPKKVTLRVLETTSLVLGVAYESN